MKDIELAIDAVKSGSKVVMNYFDNPEISLKVKDVVTNADIKAEKKMKEILLKETDYGFVGEETRNDKKDINWVVDPIDGTRSFCFGIPYFSVCVSLIDRRETKLGVVYNPVTGDIFTAEYGRGAFNNGKKIHLKNDKCLSGALVACTFSYGRKELIELDKKAGVCLVNFSPALDICNVVRGRVDAAIYGLTRVFDHSAGALIAQESDLMVSNFGSDKWDPYGTGVIVANKNLYSEIYELFPEPLIGLDEAEKQYI